MADKVKRVEVQFDINGTALDVMNQLNRAVERAQESLKQLSSLADGLKLEIDTSKVNVDTSKINLDPIFVEVHAQTSQAIKDLRSISGYRPLVSIDTEFDFDKIKGSLDSLSGLNFKIPVNLDLNGLEDIRSKLKSVSARKLNLKVNLALDSFSDFEKELKRLREQDFTIPVRVEITNIKEIEKEIAAIKPPTIVVPTKEKKERKAKVKTPVEEDVTDIDKIYGDKRLVFDLALEGEEDLLESLDKIEQRATDGFSKLGDRLGENLKSALNKPGEHAIVVDNLEDTINFLESKKSVFDFGDVTEELKLYDDLVKDVEDTHTDLNKILDKTKGEFTVIADELGEAIWKMDPSKYSLNFDDVTEELGQYDALVKDVESSHLDLDKVLDKTKGSFVVLGKTTNDLSGVIDNINANTLDFSDVTRQLDLYDEWLDRIKKIEAEEKEAAEARERAARDNFLSQEEIFEQIRTGQIKRVAGIPDDITKVVRGAANVLESTGSQINKDILERFVLASDTLNELGGRLEHYNLFLEETKEIQARTGLSVGLLVRGFERLADELETPERALAAYGLQADLVKAGQDDASAVAVKVANAYRGQSSALADLGEEYVRMIPYLDQMSHAARQAILPQLLQQWADEQKGALPTWRKDLQGFNDTLYLGAAEAAKFLQILGPIGYALPVIAGGAIIAGSAIVYGLVSAVRFGIQSLTELDKGSSRVANRISHDFKLLGAETTIELFGGQENFQATIQALGHWIDVAREAVRENKEEISDWGEFAIKSFTFATSQVVNFATVVAGIGALGLDVLLLHAKLVSEAFRFLEIAVTDLFNSFNSEQGEGIFDKLFKGLENEAPYIFTLINQAFSEQDEKIVKSTKSWKTWHDTIAELLYNAGHDVDLFKDKSRLLNTGPETELQTFQRVVAAPVFDTAIQALYDFRDFVDEYNGSLLIQPPEVLVDDYTYITKEFLDELADYAEDKGGDSFRPWLESIKTTTDKGQTYFERFVKNVKDRISSIEDATSKSIAAKILNISKTFNEVLVSVNKAVEGAYDYAIEYGVDPEQLDLANKMLERRNTLDRARIELQKELRSEELRGLEESFKQQQDNIAIAQTEYNNLLALKEEFLKADPEQLPNTKGGENKGEGKKDFDDKLAIAKLKLDEAKLGLDDLGERVEVVRQETTLWDSVLADINSKIESLNASKPTGETIKQLTDELDEHHKIRFALQHEIDLLNDAIAARRGRGFVDDELIRQQLESIKNNKAEISGESVYINLLKKRLDVFKRIGDFQEQFTSFDKDIVYDQTYEALQKQIFDNQRLLVIEKDKLVFAHEYVQELEKARQFVPESFETQIKDQGTIVVGLQRQIEASRGLLEITRQREFLEQNLTRVREKEFAVLEALEDVTYFDYAEKLANMEREEELIRKKIDLLLKEKEIRKAEGLDVSNIDNEINQLQIDLTTNNAIRDKIYEGITSSWEVAINSLQETLDAFVSRFGSELADFASGDQTKDGLSESFENSISDFGAGAGGAGGAALGFYLGGPYGAFAGQTAGSLLGGIAGGLIERLIETDAEKEAKRRQKQADDDKRKNDAERRHKEALDRLKELLALNQGIFDNSTLFLEMNRRVENVEVHASFGDDTFTRAQHRNRSDRLLF